MLQVWRIQMVELSRIPQKGRELEGKGVRMQLELMGM
jgi:hypothetical protein